jgi:predicted ATPase
VAGRSWRERIAEAIGVGEPGLSVEGEREFRVSETMLELLEHMCVRSPVVVAIEDLHWSDPGTIGVIGQIARGINAMPVALIVSARHEPRRRDLARLLELLESSSATMVRLGPLDDAAAAELVAERGAPA